jgi:hypothetical protein
MKRPGQTNQTIQTAVHTGLLTLLLLAIFLPALAIGQAPPPATPGSSSQPSSGSTPPSTNQDASVTANELLYQFNYKGTTAEQMAGTKIGAVNALPNTTWTKALAEMVKLLLNITGALALIAFTAGGAMMVFSSGNGDLLEKGKKITIFAIEGLVIIAVSYALVIGVSELQIFPDSGGTSTGTASGGQQPAATPAESGPKAGASGT